MKSMFTVRCPNSKTLIVSEQILPKNKGAHAIVCDLTFISAF